MKKNEIVLFETEDNEVKLEIPVNGETVWLSANQMAALFDRDEKTIRKHINNVFSENEVTKDNNTQKMRVDGVKQLAPYYTLDVIISVGYRVKSKRGVEFRKWANSVLRQYILQGYAVNNNRMAQLGEVIRIMKRTENTLDSRQVLSVIEKYSEALNMLDSYDHQNMNRPCSAGKKTTLSKAASVIYISLLADRSCIPASKKRLHIFCILLQKITAFSTATSELPLLCSCIFSIKTEYFLQMAAN